MLHTPFQNCVCDHYLTFCLFQREAYISMAEWLCLPKSERIAQFSKRIFKKQLKLTSGNSCSSLHEENSRTEQTHAETSGQKAVRKSHKGRIQKLLLIQCNKICILSLNTNKMLFFRPVLVILKMLEKRPNQVQMRQQIHHLQQERRCDLYVKMVYQ